MGEVCVRKRILELLKDSAVFVSGAVLYAISVNCFTAPNGIAPGGITGLATAINSITDIPIGTLTLLINIPLLVLAIAFIGGEFTVKTVAVTLLISYSIDFFSFLSVYNGEKLLCCIFGGLLSGLAIGMTFLRGGTTGGTDIVARLLRKKWKNVSAGRMILIADAVVIGVVFLVYRSLESALYAVIVIFVSTLTVDRIVYGGDGGKCFIVMSERNADIAEKIDHTLKRGVTVLSGKGYYLKNQSDVLLCSVRKNEAAQLRAIIRQTDPDAFAIAFDAAHVLGRGFSPWHSDDKV